MRVLSGPARLASEGRAPLLIAATQHCSGLNMTDTQPHGHDSGTIDLPIIDISELSYDTGKKILDAFVSNSRCPLITPEYLIPCHPTSAAQHRYTSNKLTPLRSSHTS
jgi:hypothetical protein